MISQLQIRLELYTKDPVRFCRWYQGKSRTYRDEHPTYTIKYMINGLEKWAWSDRNPITDLTLKQLLQRNNHAKKKEDSEIKV